MVTTYFEIKKIKESCYKVVKKRFKEITKWTDETNFFDLMYYYNKNTGGKRFIDSDDAIKLF